MSSQTLEKLLEEYRTANTTTASRNMPLKRRSSLVRSPKAIKKSVSFDDRHEQIFIIENAKYLPKHEIHRRWMNHRDFEKIEADNIITLYYYNNGSRPHDTNSQTVRGLEKFTKEGTHKYRENHRDAVFAVLNQQDSAGSRPSSPDQLQAAIARAYSDETEYVKLEAISIAQKDQKIAEQHYDLDCTIASIRQQQQLQRNRMDAEQQGVISRVIMKSVRRLPKSDPTTLSRRALTNPQA
jgi:hypothetical protein